jgi:hypothetical protein
MGRFFVPGAAEEGAEDLYAALAARGAAFMGRSLQIPERRVESITWTHDGEQWTATVGSQLSGTSRRQQTRRGERVMFTEQLSDAATVLAIFPGVDTYLVVTDGAPIGAARSRWANPFMAGVPEGVRYFDTASSHEN